MKLKNTLIVVTDIEKARQFYHDLFGLEMILDNDGNMILSEGLVLQEEKGGHPVALDKGSVIFHLPILINVQEPAPPEQRVEMDFAVIIPLTVV